MARTVVHYVESAVFGGTEQSMLHLASGLDRRRWRPLVLHHAAPGLAPLLERAERFGIETRVVPSVSSLRQAAGLASLVRAIRDLRPAVFHAHLTWPLACTSALLAATLARVPGVVATDQLWVDMTGVRSLFLLPRLVARLVDRYVAVSRAVAAQLRSPFRVPASKIVVVPNGIPVGDVPTADARLRSGLARTESGQLVLTTARLDAQKGHAHLVSAAAQVPEATFVLVGEGPLRPRLEALAHRMGVADRVIFLGHRDDVPALLASCDLFVLPSLYEGLPLSLLEAMASGRPVIATAVPGSSEVVQHRETGLLVPPADPRALAEAIRAALSDPAAAEQWGQAGRARVQREFSAAGMVRGVEAVYDQVLGSPLAARRAA